MEMSLFDRVVAFEEQKHGVKFKIKVDSIYIRLHPGSAGIFNRPTKTIHVRSSSSFYTLLHEMGHRLSKDKIKRTKVLRETFKRSVAWLAFWVLAMSLQVWGGLPIWLTWLVVLAQWISIFFGVDEKIFGELPWKRERELFADNFAEEERLDLVEKGIFVNKLEWWREIRS